MSAGGDVSDGPDLQASGLQGADRGLATGARALDEDVDLLQAVLLRLARGGAVALLLHAADASTDGARKLDQAWRVGNDAEGSGQRGTVLPLDRTALSVALGRDNVVHLGVAGHPGDMRAGTRVLQAVSRLVHFAGNDRTRTTHDDGRELSGHAGLSADGAAAIDEYVKD